MKKKLLITLEIMDGEHAYIIRELHTTRAKNVHLAAQIYAARFLGHERLISCLATKKKDTKGWWYSEGLERACRLYNVVELSERDYDVMFKHF